MGVGGQRHARSGQMREISHSPFFGPRPLYWNAVWNLGRTQRCKYGFRKHMFVFVWVRWQFQQLLPGVMRQEMYRAKNCRPCSLLMNLQICGVRLKQFPDFFPQKTHTAGTSVRRRKSQNFICVHSAKGMSMNFMGMWLRFSACALYLNALGLLNTYCFSHNYEATQHMLPYIRDGNMSILL
jgi:hypothetical protein